MGEEEETSRDNRSREADEFLTTASTTQFQVHLACNGAGRRENRQRDAVQSYGGSNRDRVGAETAETDTEPGTETDIGSRSREALDLTAASTRPQVQVHLAADVEWGIGRWMAERWSGAETGRGRQRQQKQRSRRQSGQ